jgi:hypothetical protein
MAGLVPAIHVFSLKARKKDVDARDERGHDGVYSLSSHCASFIYSAARFTTSGAVA